MINMYNIDCIEFMKGKPDNYYDLAIVDPPYGIGEDGSKTKGRTFNKNGKARLSIDKRNGRKSLIFNSYVSKNWDLQSPSQNYFDSIFRISKKQIIWGCNYLKFTQNESSSGRIFWDKVNFDNDYSDGELAWTNLHTSIRQFEFMWNGMLQGKSINEGRINQGNKSLCEKRIHPTQKPVALYKWLLKNYAKEGDKIFDSHGGSGSICIACHDMKFVLDWCELDKDYFEAAKKRFENHKKQLTLF